MGEKKDKSRLNVFYILHTLKKYTDSQNPLKAKEIAWHINQDFGNGENIISGSTVKRILQDFCDTVFVADSGLEEYEIRNRIGYYVYTVTENHSKDREVEEKYVTYPQLHGEEDEFELCKEDSDEEKKAKITHRKKRNAQKPVKYYYYESDLSVGEIRALRDVIETCSCFSSNETNEIIQKLMNLQPLAFRKNAN